MDIYSLALCSSLPTLPFEVLGQVLDSSPLSTDDGISLRKNILEFGVLDVILNCLSIFTHVNTESVAALIKSTKNHTKRTGTQSWKAEQVLFKQKYEEQHIIALLQVLSSYINPEDAVPNEEKGTVQPSLNDILQKSCLIPALCSYLSNDSVLDIMKRVPLYRTILKLLRALSISSDLANLLIKKEGHDSIATLIHSMKSCIETYALRLMKKANSYDSEDKELEVLVSEIQKTISMIQSASIDNNAENDEEKSVVAYPMSNMSIEEKYVEIMKALQFDSFEMIEESGNGYRFTVPYTFEMMLRLHGNQGHSGRLKRLAQEAATLSTSSLVSFNSSIFIRQDADRLDVMKCLITGSAETPYANGCFEFDVYFPPDYPNSPVMLSFKTSGRNLPFNPNLYNNGQVCLSLLNTWHGSPETRWNPQKTLLEVLVIIQSFVLGSEPYFNEPAYEKIRGTPKGDQDSRVYKCNVYVATIQWAIINQILNPSPCFKDVIYTHFWMKRNEICEQVENWIKGVNALSENNESPEAFLMISEVLRHQYENLRYILSELPVPENLDNFKNPFHAKSLQ